MKKVSLTITLHCIISFNLILCNNYQFSTAGFLIDETSNRNVYNFNVGWRYFNGDVKDAMQIDFDDSEWSIVSLPHSVELLPSNASGGRNYQGVVCYRKHFKLDKSYADKKVWVHFEAIMGKSKIYLNGKLIKEHSGGFLPITIDLSLAGVQIDGTNILAIYADNSNDTSYPPGKIQEAMDFCYFGGIYRDCWLYTTPLTYVTDRNYAGLQAGGGVFVSFENVSEKEATVRISTHIINEEKQTKKIQLRQRLIDVSGKTFSTIASNITLKSGESRTIVQKIKVIQPRLWHPDSPNLYNLNTEIIERSRPLDGIVTRIGIRSIELQANEGLFINGKHFKEKLLGVNRHQDFGYIGMAMSNNLHYADVLKLRDAGFRVIRSAHYPQDPAFMDACDRLGMFIIVATPGWQFWNDDPIFEERVLSDIQNMIRRDRNHPSVLFWEPILNETHFPVQFAKKAYETVHQEYPYKGCYAAIDDLSPGSEYFDIIYCAPKKEEFYTKLGKCCFTREFGDCVDDWYSHNSYSRVSRGWSEQGLIHQAQHYAKKDYEGSLTVDQLFKSPAAHIGGTLWHSFDHQRGYHPDPFYGGIMDAFRQPKYSYQMFKSQRNAILKHPITESGPFVFIANAMTPISPEDVVVYSNCDSVRLIITADNKLKEKQTAAAFNIIPSAESRFYTDTIIKPVIKGNPGVPNEPIIFNDAFSFITIRALHRAGLEDRAKIVAEGVIHDKVVTRKEQMPSKRSDRIKLTINDSGLVPQANGSDIIVITASILDKRGYLRQLAMEKIEFQIEGEGEIIGDEEIGANPCIVEGGTAPLLVRTTTNPGVVKIIAKLPYDGINTATPDTLTLSTIASEKTLLYSELPTKGTSGFRIKKTTSNDKISVNRDKQIRKVEEDQKFFEDSNR